MEGGCDVEAGPRPVPANEAPHQEEQPQEQQPMSLSEWRTRAEAVREERLFDNDDIVDAEGNPFDAADNPLWCHAGITTIGDLYDAYGDLNYERTKSRLQAAGAVLSVELAKLEEICSGIPRQWKVQLWDRPLDISDRSGGGNTVLTQARLNRHANHGSAGKMATDVAVPPVAPGTDPVLPDARGSSSSGGGGGGAGHVAVALASGNGEGGGAATAGGALTAKDVERGERDKFNLLEGVERAAADVHALHRLNRLQTSIVSSFGCCSFGPVQAAFDRLPGITSNDYWASLTTLHRMVAPVGAEPRLEVPSWMLGWANKDNSKFARVCVACVRLWALAPNNGTNKGSNEGGGEVGVRSATPRTRVGASRATAPTLPAAAVVQTGAPNTLEDVERLLLDVVAECEEGEGHGQAVSLAAPVWVLLMQSGLARGLDQAELSRRFRAATALHERFFPAWCVHLRVVNEREGPASAMALASERAESLPLAALVPTCMVLQSDLSACPHVRSGPLAAPNAPAQVDEAFEQWTAELAAEGRALEEERAAMLYCLWKCNRWRSCAVVLAMDEGVEHLRWHEPWASLAEGEWAKMRRTTTATRLVPLLGRSPRCSSSCVLGTALAIGLVVASLVCAALLGLVLLLMSLGPAGRYLVIISIILVVGLCVAMKATQTSLYSQRLQALRAAEKERNQKLVAGAFAAGARSSLQDKRHRASAKRRPRADEDDNVVPVAQAC